MSDTSQPTTDEAGVPRTKTGQIQDQTSTSPAEASTTPPTSTTPEPKTDSKPEDKSLLSTKPEDKSGAPEKYADFKTPDGFEFDADSLTKAQGLFKELGLSQNQAQKLVDYYSNLSLADAESTQNRFKEMVNGWKNESLNHADLKGKMERNGPVLTAVAKTIDSLGPALAAEFREVMDLTGVGNHPAFIRAFYAIAQQLSEPSHVTGRGPSAFGQAAPNRPAGPGPAALYPNLPSA